MARGGLKQETYVRLDPTPPIKCDMFYICTGTSIFQIFSYYSKSTLLNLQPSESQETGFAPIEQLQKNPCRFDEQFLPKINIFL